MRDALGRVGRVAIIGGTSDIGLAVARELVHGGAHAVVLAGRDPESMRAAAADLPVESTITLDVGRIEDHAEAVADLFAGGDLDVVVLAAGVLTSDPDPREVARMHAVNGSGAVSVLAHLADRLRGQGHGTIVILSTIATIRPRPSNFWYGSSKAPLDFAGRGLVRRMAPYGVDVLVVRQGFVHTKMTADLPPAPLSTRPGAVGRAVSEAVRTRRTGVLWVPPGLRVLAFLLRVIPQRLLEKVDR